MKTPGLFVVILLILGITFKHSNSQDLEDTIIQLLQTILEEQILQRNDQQRRLDEITESIASLRESIEGRQVEPLDPQLQCSTKGQVNEILDFIEKDECQQGRLNCSTFATCKDYLGYYTCTCLPGYAGDGYDCQDVDECLDVANRCEANEECLNSMGSYSCVCAEGFKREETLCIDVDECSSLVRICDVNASCTNTIGSYTCQCHQSYVGDGHTCEECRSPSLYLDKLGCIIFHPEEVAWEEAKWRCEVNNSRLLEGLGSKVQVDVIRKHFHPLHAWTWYPWTGAKDSQWVSSGEYISSSSGLWKSGEPNGGDSECVVLDVSQYYGLYDYECSTLRPYFCQRGGF